MDLLGQIGLDAGAREAIQARLEVSSATTADRVDASALAGIAAHSNHAAPSVAGGNQRIALSLAAELGEAVRLSSPVSKVRWSDRGVRISVGGGELDADRVVITVPASVIGRIDFDPPLPEALSSAYSVRPSTDMPRSCSCRSPGRRSPSAVLSVPERLLEAGPRR